MDMEETIAALQSTNEQLRQENNQLKTMMSVVKENADLRAKMQNSDILEELTDCSTSAGAKPPSLLQNTCDERQFSRDLRQTKHDRQTSSPVDFKAFIQNSMYTDTSETQSCQADMTVKVKDPEKFLGEIVYQLDRRILFHIFQSHRRLYGFTLLNIPDKIIQVSTHPLTRRVDEGYRRYLTERYNDLMKSLNQLGYRTTLHPPFAEFIANTYGILKQRPSDCSTQGVDFNNPEYLRRLITTSAPRQLQTDLLILLTCLCNMAERDKKPLFLW